MNSSKSIVYLIPSILSENNTNVIPGYVLDAVKNCQAFFVENERSARRFLKSLWKEMVIDNYEWYTINKHASNLTRDPEIFKEFKRVLKEDKKLGIISEAGCPGVADPGQELVAIAQSFGVTVKPLVGPSSILLALMGSGMNGQQFQFVGYLPIDATQRVKAIKDLETESARKNCTQIFIETPYRNNQLLELLLKVCQPGTRLCLAVNLTASNEFIQTKTINDWKKKLPDLHKQPAIFLVLA
jgi:16S rRNA (cytidine1402-2'-O)-methyltransferase